MSLNLQDPNTAKMFMRWTNNNEDATRLLMQMCTLAREIDDLVDVGGDYQHRVTSIVELALVHIASNPFYMRFNGVMSGLIFEMLTYWRLGDDFKKSDNEKKQMFGYVYRESTDRLAVVIASLIGGSDHAMDVAKELYEKTHGESSETLADWLAEEEVEPDGTVRRDSPST